MFARAQLPTERIEHVAVLAGEAKGQGGVCVSGGQECTRRDARRAALASNDN